MPLREYKCTKCERIYEVLEKRDENMGHCEKCGGLVQLLISKAGFELVGSGWANDHYGLIKNTGETKKD